MQMIFAFANSAFWQLPIDSDFEIFNSPDGTAISPDEILSLPFCQNFPYANNDIIVNNVISKHVTLMIK